MNRSQMALRVLKTTLISEDTRDLLKQSGVPRTDFPGKPGVSSIDDGEDALLLNFEGFQVGIIFEVKEATVTAQQCAETSPSWDEDIRFPRNDWQYEVANGDTQLGYAEWVQHQIDADRKF